MFKISPEGSVGLQADAIGSLLNEEVDRQLIPKIEDASKSLPKDDFFTFKVSL